MKATVWTVMPNHYLSPFFAALRGAGIDVCVNYYGCVTEDRLRMGWSGFQALPPGERYVKPEIGPDSLGADWRERIHILPGCGERFLRALAIYLSRNGVPWAHWSEPAHPGWRWYAGYPLRRWYARLVNRYALGAFAIGEVAVRDFLRWGVRAEKVALLTYSNPTTQPEAEPDILCEQFRGRRKAFCFVGALEPRKGIDVLVRAFAVVAKASDEWVLLLAGDDRSNGKYARQVADLGCGGRVLFRGPVSCRAVSSVLRSSQVLVLPSRFDGWGVVLNEGASMGLALIATDRCGAAYHLIQPGENGLRVHAGSVESLVSAMAAYARSPELAAKHGRESARIAREYSPERNAKRFVAALETWQAQCS
jgi:glycosyltransferase involved in cell wall biosynthesis